MNITVEPKPISQVSLTIEISPAEMQPYLEKAAAELSKEHKIEGFRPGKASLGIVIQRLSAQHVWETAAELAVRKTLVQAIMDKKIATIGQPHIHILKLAPDNPFIYQADTAVLPTIELGSYDQFKMKKNRKDVSPTDVDKAVEDLREMFASEALVDRAAKIGDKVEVDFDLTVGKVPVENGSSKQHPIKLGSGHFIPGFEDQLVGMKKDDHKNFSLAFPKEYHQAVVAGKSGDFSVTMKSVFEITKPELNDDFATKAGKFTNLADLRTKLTDNLKTAGPDRRRWRASCIEGLTRPGRRSATWTPPRRSNPGRPPNANRGNST